MFAIVLQRPQTHDPGRRAAVYGTVIGNDQQLFVRFQGIDSRKPLLRLRRLERDENKRHEGRLFHQPVTTTHAELALRIVKNVKAFHCATTGTRACGGTGGGAVCKSARRRIFENTKMLKKCMPPSTSI